MFSKKQKNCSIHEKNTISPKPAIDQFIMIRGKRTHQVQNDQKLFERKNLHYNSDFLQ